MVCVMGILLLSVAGLAALAPPPAVASSAIGSASFNSALSAPARRSPGGASATITVSVTITSNAARIGHGAPPAAGMIPRVSTIAAADGRPVDALIYDFE